MIYTVYNDNLIRYDFLLVFKRIQERWKTAKTTDWVWFVRQEECLRINLSVYTSPKKRLMHFHFENDINNPIPKLSTWNRVKIRIQLHLMIRLCEKKIKNPWHCNWVSRSNNRKTRNFLLWSIQQWLANICVGDKELPRHLLY